MMDLRQQLQVINQLRKNQSQLAKLSTMDLRQQLQVINQLRKNQSQLAKLSTMDLRQQLQVINQLRKNQSKRFPSRQTRQNTLRPPRRSQRSLRTTRLKSRLRVNRSASQQRQAM